MEEIYLESRSEWRKWLAKNHKKSSGIWLVFYKKHTQKRSIKYDAAVEEALCFGWIDSIIKKLDEDRYARKFTPRKPDSEWSEINRKRVKKIIHDGRMTEAGLAKINAAKKKGLYEKPGRPELSYTIPGELKEALEKNPKANIFFNQLAPTYRKHYNGWISTAKRKETKERRVKESISLLERGKKLGLK